MKKILVGLLVLSMLMLSGCSPLVKDDGAAHQTIYASFYPVYALTRLIVDDDIPEMDVHQLVQPQDGCLRSYELSDWDLYLVAYNADAVFIASRGLESFSSNLEALNGPVVAGIFNGLQLENQGEIASDEDASHLQGENPYVYLSVRQLDDIMETVAAYMSELDPDYSHLYEVNYREAIQKIDAFSEEILSMISDDERQSVALLNEAFIYVAQDHNLPVACRIDRESGVEMSATELEEMLSTLSQSGAKVVLIEKQAPMSMIDALTEAGYSVALLDTMSTGTESMGSEGYFTAIHENTQSLKDALDRASGD